MNLDHSDEIYDYLARATDALADDLNELPTTRQCPDCGQTLDDKINRITHEIVNDACMGQEVVILGCSKTRTIEI